MDSQDKIKKEPTHADPKETEERDREEVRELIPEDISPEVMESLKRTWAPGFFARFVQQAPSSIVVFDHEARVIMANRAFGELFDLPPGYSNDDRNAVDDPYNTAQGVSKFFRRAMKGESVEVHDFEFPSPVTGRRIVASGKIFPMFGAQGEVTHLVLMHEDVTARKIAEEKLQKHQECLEELVEERTQSLAQVNAQLKDEMAQRARAQAALREEKELLSTALSSIDNGVIVVDEEARVLMMNETAGQLTRVAPTQGVGRPLREIYRVERDVGGKHLRAREAEVPSSDENRDPLAEVLVRGRPWHGRQPSSLSPVESDERLVILESIHPLFGEPSVFPGADETPKEVKANESPGRLGAVIGFRDVTHTRRLEQSLLQAQKLDSLGVLAGGIAHDFNNLLTEIVGGISLAKWQVGDGSRARETLEAAERACAHARELTQQLLTFSEGGAPVKEVTSLEDLVRDAVGLSMRGGNVKCHVVFSGDLPPCACDSGQIRQVIHNLTLNAKQSMPEGGEVVVELEKVDVTERMGLPLQSGPYLCVNVSDVGEGILPEHLPRIFDPFFTTRKHGSGLGLATTHSIVRSHAGHIQVDTQQGEGTTFRVYLPVEARDERREVQPQKSPTGKRKRVLLMDDEPGVRYMVSGMLHFLGYHVDTAEEGREAVKLYQEALESGRRYDVVILDITVPGGMGGEETIKELRAVDPQVVGVVSSGYSNDRILADHKRYGFRGVVAKPYRLEDLREALGELFPAPDSEDSKLKVGSRLGGSGSR